MKRTFRAIPGKGITAARKTRNRRPIKAATYNGFDESEFNKEELNWIRRGLEKGLDISWYANPKFSGYQRSQIFQGLEKGLDVSWYADPRFSWSQMEEIREGLEAGIDVSKYADPNCDANQMYKIKKRLEAAKLRRSKSANPNTEFYIEFYIETMSPTSKNTFNMSDKAITIKCVDYDPGQSDGDIEDEDEYFASDLNATYGAVYKLKVTVKKLSEGFENAEEYANERIAERAQEPFPEGYSIE